MALSLERLPYPGALQFHAQGLLAYYDYAISTGPLEGINNKVKTMKLKPMASETNTSSSSKSTLTTKPRTL